MPLELTPEAMVQRLERTEHFPFTRAEDDRPVDGFEAPEIAAALILFEAFQRVAVPGEKQLRDALGSARVGASQLLDMVQDAFQETSRAFGDDEAAKLTPQITRAVNSGALEAQVDRYAQRNPLQMRSLYSGMIDAAKYTTNTYFNRLVYPALDQAIRTAIEAPGSDALVGFDDIRQTIATRMKTVPYWRIVANGAASRGYHWGLLHAGSDAGYTSYEFRAVIDDRTTAFCRSLNGTIWTVRDALPVIDRAAVATLEELRTVSPWRTTAEQAAEARSDGVVIPPCHANCRSRLDLRR